MENREVPSLIKLLLEMLFLLFNMIKAHVFNYSINLLRQIIILNP